MFCNALTSQNKLSDSVLVLLGDAKHDTSKCNILSALIDKQPTPDLWAPFNEEIERICDRNLYRKQLSSEEKLFYKKALALATNNKGYLAQVKGNYAEASDMYLRTLKLQDEIQAASPKEDQRKGKAYIELNLASTYTFMGDLKKSLEYYNKALPLLEALNDEKGISVALNNLTNLYTTMGDRKTALTYGFRCLALKQKTKDQHGIATVYSNIGSIYMGMRKADTASRYFGLSLNIYEQRKDTLNCATLLTNLGSAFQQQGNYSLAVNKYEKALALAEKIKSKQAIASSCMMLADAHLVMNNEQKALKYGERSLELFRELGHVSKIMHASNVLKDIYKSTGNYDKAMDVFLLYRKMKDSLFNQGNRKAALRTQMKYEYDRKATADSVARAKDNEIWNAESEKQEAEISAGKIIQYSLFSGLVVVILFGAYILSRSKVMQRQKKLIESQKQDLETQKEIVDEKQKEILDSIRYARRIQQAQMPNKKIIEKKLNTLKG